MKTPFIFALALILNARANDIAGIEHIGQLVRSCTLPGETRDDDVVPRHANAIQLSRSRWLVIYSTHGYRGVDDERSIIYQVRRDAPDGAVVKEGFLARGSEDWFPAGFDKGSLRPSETVYKQHGHMVAFGVPKGATLGGKPLPHANHFVAKWRVAGRILNRETQFLKHGGEQLVSPGVEWMQFRLNDREDDIDITQPVAALRQKGFETGDAFCAGAVKWMNQSFCPAVSANRECSEWADANHFDGDRVAALKYRFDPVAQRYEWIAMGPLLGERNRRFFEASLVHLPDGWLVAGRGNNEVGWARAENPFAAWPPLRFSKTPAINAPMTLFRCADGVVRLFSGDRTESPTRNARDPLYCWDITAGQDWTASKRRELFSSIAARLPIRRESQVKVDFCELFPAHGRAQIVAFGVSTRAMNHPYQGQPTIPIQNADEKVACGLYYSRITFRDEPPAVWEFGK